MAVQECIMQVIPTRGNPKGYKGKIYLTLAEPNKSLPSCGWIAIHCKSVCRLPTLVGCTMGFLGRGKDAQLGLSRLEPQLDKDTTLCRGISNH